jgi:hypothetical protein
MELIPDGTPERSEELTVGDKLIKAAENIGFVRTPEFDASIKALIAAPTERDFRKELDQFSNLEWSVYDEERRLNISPPETPLKFMLIKAGIYYSKEWYVLFSYELSDANYYSQQFEPPLTQELSEFFDDPNYERPDLPYP